jgi:hypothetical protein
MKCGSVIKDRLARLGWEFLAPQEEKANAAEPHRNLGISPAKYVANETGGKNSYPLGALGALARGISDSRCACGGQF